MYPSPFWYISHATLPCVLGFYRATTLRASTSADCLRSSYVCISLALPGALACEDVLPTHPSGWFPALFFLFSVKMVLDNGYKHLFSCQGYYLVTQIRESQVGYFVPGDYFLMYLGALTTPGVLTGTSVLHWIHYTTPNPLYFCTLCLFHRAMGLGCCSFWA